MNDDVAPPAAEAITSGQTPQSPAQGAINSLNLKLIAASEAGAPPLMLHGSFKLDVQTTGRYSGRIPAPVHVVAVARGTGQVYIQRLVRNEEQPPKFRGAAAAPSVVRVDPDGATSTKGIAQSGYFNVDLKKHLGLPDAGDEYDVFLWLENIVSDVVTATKPAEDGKRPGSPLFQRPATVATIRPAAKSDLLELAGRATNEGRLIVGRSGKKRVSIVAYSLSTNAIGCTVLEAPKGDGLEFEIKVNELVPGSGTERVFAFAIAEGRRSALLDLSGKE